MTSKQALGATLVAIPALGLLGVAVAAVGLTPVLAAIAFWVVGGVAAAMAAMGIILMTGNHEAEID
jgi:hypothetical protein